MRLGICGLGQRAATVASCFRTASDSVDVVGYVDPSPYGLSHLNAFGLKPTAYDDLAALAKNEELDLLVVGSPNHLHLEHIEQALTMSNAVVFTEKPAVALGSRRSSFFVYSSDSVPSESSWGLCCATRNFIGI